MRHRAQVDVHAVEARILRGAGLGAAETLRGLDAADRAAISAQSPDEHAGPAPKTSEPSLIPASSARASSKRPSFILACPMIALMIGRIHGVASRR